MAKLLPVGLGLSNFPASWLSYPNISFYCCSVVQVSEFMWMCWSSDLASHEKHSGYYYCGGSLN